MGFDAVLFDLDGTLLNTLEDLAAATNYALTQYALPSRTLDDIRLFTGDGVRKLVERASGFPEGPQLDMCVRIFRAYYAGHMTVATRPYPGITPLLMRLKAMDVKTAVVSNKYDAAVKELCRRYFPGLIDVAMGDKPGLRPKPDPSGVLAAIEALEAKKTLCVGDSATDIHTAHNACLPCLSVAWGFRSYNSLQEAGADRIIRDVDDFFEAMRELSL